MTLPASPPVRLLGEEARVPGCPCSLPALAGLAVPPDEAPGQGRACTHMRASRSLGLGGARGPGCRALLLT